MQQKKRAGSTLEILQVWGWAGCLASVYLIWKLDGGWGERQIFCFRSLSCCKTTLRGVADAQLGWAVLGSGSVPAPSCASGAGYRQTQLHSVLGGTPLASSINTDIIITVTTCCSLPAWRSFPGLR